MSNSRKINYFEIKVTEDNVNCRQVINELFEYIDHFNSTKAPERKITTANGLTLHIHEVLPYLQTYWKGKARLIYDEFPEVTDKEEDTNEIIEAENDPRKGIPEETHFVLSKNPHYAHPVIAIESCMKGPKHGDIERYFERMLHQMGLPHNLLRFEPVFAFDYDSFVERISDIAYVKMSFRHDDIPHLTEYDKRLGALLSAANDYGEMEYITLEFSINFRSRRNRLGQTHQN